MYTTLSFMFRPKELPPRRGEKLDRRSVVQAGGHDLFMNVTVAGHNVDSPQAEISTARQQRRRDAGHEERAVHQEEVAAAGRRELGGLAGRQNE